MTYFVNVVVSYREQRRQQRILNQRNRVKALRNATRTQYHNVR